MSALQYSSANQNSFLSGCVLDWSMAKVNKGRFSSYLHVLQCLSDLAMFLHFYYKRKIESLFEIKISQICILQEIF